MHDAIELFGSGKEHFQDCALRKGVRSINHAAPVQSKMRSEVGPNVRILGGILVQAGCRTGVAIAHRFGVHCNYVDSGAQLVQLVPCTLCMALLHM